MPTVKISDLPAVPQDASQGTQDFLSAVRSILLVREGMSGNKMDNMVTWRDLALTGVVGQSASGVNGIPVVYTSPYTPPSYATPPQPTGLVASGVFANIGLSWTVASFAGYASTEVWRSTTANQANAVLIGSAYGGLYTDTVANGTTYYYWIRFRNVNNVVGPYSTMATGTTLTDPTYLLSVLTGSITSSQLSTALSSSLATSSSVTTLQTSFNQADGMYTVKLDAAGNVSGFGLQSSLRAGGIATSDFFVKTNRFAVLSPTTVATTAPATPYIGQVWRNSTTNITYKWNGTTWVANAQASMPLAVLTTNFTAPDGTVFTPGVYIDGSAVVNGTLSATALVANSITATQMNLTGGLSALTANLGTITSGSISIGAGATVFTVSSTGFMTATGANISGNVTITGGSGYAALTDKPTSLAGVNAAEGTKLTGIQAGATVGATWGSNITGVPGNLSVLTGTEAINNTLVTPAQIGANGVVGSGNIYPNGDFLLSTGGIPTGYAVYNNAGAAVTNSITAGGALSGSSYWRITHNLEANGTTIATSTFGFFFSPTQVSFPAIQPNTTYTISFYARCGGLPGAIFYLSWNVAPATTGWLKNNAILTTWQRYIFTFTTGAAVDPNIIYVTINAPVPVGNYLDFSCVQVEQGDCASGWAPTAVSTLNPIAVGSGNIYPNGDFLLSTGGRPTGYVANNNAGAAVTNSITAGGALPGSNYWRITHTLEANGTTINTISFGFFFTPADFGYPAIQPNTTYTISFYARCGGLPGAIFNTAWSVAPTSGWLKNNAILTTWQRYIFTFTTGATVDQYIANFSINVQVPVGNYLDFSCVQVEQGDCASGWAPTAVSTLNPISATNSGNLIGAGAISVSHAQPGLVNANLIDPTGRLGVVSATAPATGSGLALNSSGLGYYNAGVWKTYMSNTGGFYLAGAGTDSLSWNGTALTVTGTINAIGGNFSGNVTGAANVDIAGLARFRGTSGTNTFIGLARAAMLVNDLGSSEFGIVCYAGTTAGGGNRYVGSGVYAIADGTGIVGSPIAIRAQGQTANSIAISALGATGGLAFSMIGDSSVPQRPIGDATANIASTIYVQRSMLGGVTNTAGDQAWNTYTTTSVPSRLANTVYTNTTGRPIFIFLNYNAGGVATITVTTGATSIVVAQGAGNASLASQTLSTIVPAGSSYSTNAQPVLWAELA